MSSSTIIPKELYLRTGFTVAQHTLAHIQGNAGISLASGRCLDRLDEFIATGFQMIGVSIDEDLHEFKQKAASRITVLGNLNGIEMRRWTSAQAEYAVKTAIAKAGRGGGFILADNHGEIPWQVSDAVLLAISDAAERWGHYPLDWIETDE